MQSIICTDLTTLTQQLDCEWFGNPVTPAVQYSFSTDGDNLVYRAAQNAPVRPHPDGKNGVFREELWKYDTAEFFIASENGSPYVEVNISPNGAWWACAFSAPRVPLTPAVEWKGVQANGMINAQGWQCSISIPLSILAALGITPEKCRLVATAILNSPDYIFLTTAEDTYGKPDFHRPHTWPMAILS